MIFKCEILTVREENTLEEFLSNPAYIDLSTVVHWYYTDKGTALIDEALETIAIVTKPSFDKLSAEILKVKRELVYKWGS